MKKAIRYVFCSFIFVFCFMCVSNKVNAQEVQEITNYFDRLQNFDIETMEPATENKVNATAISNYKIHYDYKIFDRVVKGESYITDAGVPIAYIYGVNINKVAFEYEDIKGDLLDWINDSFVVQKYNSITGEFENKFVSDVDASGTYTITERGLYKVFTLDDGKNNGTTSYVLCETSAVSLEIDGIEPYKIEEIFQEVEGAQVKHLEITFNFKLTQLKDTNVCDSGTIKFNGISDNITTCTLTKEIAQDEKFTGKYYMQVTFTPMVYVYDGQYGLIYSGKEVTGNINYDMVAPEKVVLNYYNEDLFHEDFKIEGNVISLKTLIEMEIREDNDIKEAYLSYDDDKKIACTISEGQEENQYFIYCYMSEQSVSRKVNINVIDNYDNQLVIEKVYDYDLGVLPQGDDILNHIGFDSGYISVDFDGEQFDDLDKICIFYGDNLLGKHDCRELPLISNFTSQYYYKGALSIVIIDEAGNYELLSLNEALFPHGYDINNFTFNDVNGDDTYRHDVEQNINDLKAIACGSDVECLEEGNIYVEYGNKKEEFEDTSLPTYLELLNNYFKDSLCSSTKCEKQVRVAFTYKVGNIDQEVKAYYNYLDLLPRMQNAISYQENVTLEYKKFDINSVEIKRLLYVEEVRVTLIDDNGNNYSAKITPAFVDFTDRKGNYKKLDYLSYEALPSLNEFGFYTLECRVKLLSKAGVDYQEEKYAKSFFIRVELKDSILPVLTLLGEKEMVVKQYGAYKDPSFECEDSSGCAVKVSYYLNDESNPVEGIDTSIVGKYIVKYVGVDGDNNESIVATRIVVVESINALDKTSIITIAVIGVSLVAFIAIGIIVEVKKNKKYKKKEEY